MTEFDLLLRQQIVNVYVYFVFAIRTSGSVCLRERCKSVNDDGVLRVLCEIMRYLVLYFFHVHNDKMALFEFG